MVQHKIIELDKAVKAIQIMLLISFYILTIAASQQTSKDKVVSLIKKLNNPHKYARAQAARELGKIKDNRAVQPLINALKDTDSYVRGEAAEALGEIKDSRAVQPLITTLKDDDYLYVREESVKALGEIKDSRAVQPLINALNNEHIGVREEAVKALIEIGTPAIEPLNHAIKENNLRVVANAYYFFICIGEPGTEKILVEALQKYGTKNMAIDFINCGNIQLKEAAYKWTESHGYKIKKGIDVSNGPTWNRFKS
jgi:HEAT repeat protein